MVERGGRDWIRLGLAAAAFVNLAGVPLLTRGFSNDYLASVDPILFSVPSQFLIVVWGIAYLALIPYCRTARGLWLAFAAEKLFYGLQWFLWLASDRPSLAEIWSNDLFAGFWYTVYGPVDTAFGIFFVYAFFKVRS